MSRKKYETDEEYKKRRHQEYEQYYNKKIKHERENAIILGIYIKDFRVSDYWRKKIESGERQILIVNNKLMIFKKAPNGYWRNNSNGKITYLHREKLKQHLGLTDEQMKGYEVHHIDRNRDNNDISNLQLLTTSEHQKLHAKRSNSSKRHVCKICGRTYYSSVSSSAYICNRCI